MDLNQYLSPFAFSQTPISFNQNVPTSPICRLVKSNPQLPAPSNHYNHPFQVEWDADGNEHVLNVRCINQNQLAKVGLLDSIKSVWQTNHKIPVSAGMLRTCYALTFEISRPTGNTAPPVTWEFFFDNDSQNALKIPISRKNGVSPPTPDGTIQLQMNSEMPRPRWDFNPTYSFVNSNFPQVPCHCCLTLELVQNVQKIDLQFYYMNQDVMIPFSSGNGEFDIKFSQKTDQMELYTLLQKPPDFVNNPYLQYKANISCLVNNRNIPTEAQTFTWTFSKPSIHLAVPIQNKQPSRKKQKTTKTPESQTTTTSTTTTNSSNSPSSLLQATILHFQQFNILLQLPFTLEHDHAYSEAIFEENLIIKPLDQGIDSLGCNLLHWLAVFGCLESLEAALQIILERDAIELTKFLELKNRDGHTPKDLAVMMKQQNSASLFEYFSQQLQFEIDISKHQTPNDSNISHASQVITEKLEVESLEPGSLEELKKLFPLNEKEQIELPSLIPQQYYNETRSTTMERELTNQIQQLQMEVNRLRNENTKFANQKSNFEKDEIERTKLHLQQLDKLRKVHTSELIKFDFTQKAQISDLKTSHHKEILELKELHDKNNSILMEKHLQEIHGELEKTNEKLNEQSKYYEQLLAEARKDRQNSLSDLEPDLKTKYSLKLKSKDIEIENLRKQLAKREFRKSFQYQRQLENLEQQLKIEAKNNSKTTNIREVDCEKDLPPGIVLGDGAFGRVFKSKLGIQNVAVKTIKLGDVDSSDLRRIKQSFEKELETLNRARHPNIVNVVGACKRIDHLSIVLELAERGSLYRYIHQTKGFKFSEEQTIRILIDISNGMNYLHQFKPQIIHRDLKSDNILLFSDWTAKVTDFGLSKLKEASSLANTERSGMVGTVNWMAPEMMDPNLPKTTNKIDVYSFGMVIFEMLNWDEEHQTHLKPWNGMNLALIAASVREGRRPPDPVPKKADPKKNKKVSGDLVFNSLLSLMKKCWDQNASERPSFSIVVSELEKLENGVVNVFVDWKLSPDLLLIEGWKSPPNISTSRTLTINPLPTLTTSSSNRNILNVIQNSIVLENEKLTSLLAKLHNTKSFKIEQAHVIDNSALQISFESRIDSLNRKILENPSLFGPKPVSPHSSSDQFRQKILNRLDLYAEQWLHNQNKGNLQLIPMFHALQNEKSGWSIAGTGFSNLQRFDEGYFGSGIYFTSNLEYACKYVETPTQLEGGKKGYWIMLSWVLIGNAFPVIEHPHFKGKPIEPGYDAHWTIVKHEGGKVYIPISPKEPELLNENLTELVVNQESQCLPMYLLFVTK